MGRKTAQNTVEIVSQEVDSNNFSNDHMTDNNKSI